MSQEEQGIYIGALALVAGIDEYYQTFIPERTGQISDVIIDSLGELVGYYS